MFDNHSLFSDAGDLDRLEAAPNNDEMQRKETQARRSLAQLGKRVEQLRLAKTWNRTTLAQKAHVTIATVRGLEAGTKVTQPKKLRLVALALGTTVQRLEADDTKDPRLKNWSDEDYEIGNWYHNAPRALKNRIWALHEVADAGNALVDPQFLPLLEEWPKLEQVQKNFVLSSFTYIRKQPADAAAGDTAGGVDALAPVVDPRSRGPHR